MLLPIGKQKRYPALDLTVIHAREEGVREGRPEIDWKLITDLPVTSPGDAVRMLVWYAMRWKIEVFHKILKSGSRAEEARRASRQPHRHLLHHGMAIVLDDDDQPRRAQRIAQTCPYR